MARCASCNRLLFLGGVRDGERRYCNQQCHADGKVKDAAAAIPPGEVLEHVHRLHRGPCPRCQGPGPVDLFTAHQVWSAILVTSWKDETVLACRTCGRRKQWEALGISTVAGWWGFPAGIIITPIQVTKGIAALLRDRDLAEPSPALESLARTDLALKRLGVS